MTRSAAAPAPAPPPVAAGDGDGDLPRQLDHLKGQIERERRARDYRAEVQALLVGTSTMVTPGGVARVIARGFAHIIGAGWVCVGFVDPKSPDAVRFVFDDGVPSDVSDDWQSAPLGVDVPMAAILRGDVESVRLPDRHGFEQWPTFAGEADRALIGSFYCLAVPAVDGRLPAAAIGLAWPTGHVMDETEGLLLDDIITASAPAFERARRTQFDRRVARTLQNWLLPPTIPEIDDLDIGTLYIPSADEMAVGGDWYDVVQIDDATTAFVVGDVVGHNARAAAEMGQVRHVLASHLMASAGDVVGSLRRTDDYFSRRSPDTMATAIVIVMRSAQERVVVASAGHIPPVVLHPERAAELLDFAVGPPIGAGIGGYGSTAFSLPTGSMIVAMTDGVVERRKEAIDESLADLCADLDGLAADERSDAARVTAMLHARVQRMGRDDDAAAILLRRR